MICPLGLPEINCLISNRTVFHTAPTSSAEIHIDAASPFFDLHLKISRRALHRLQIRIGDKFYVQMPADLDQFR
jgi:hypothetical protein